MVVRYAKLAGVGICLLFSGYVGSKIYRYFAYTKAPHVTVAGVDFEAHQRNTIAPIISTDGAYKIAAVKVFLDDAPLKQSSAAEINALTINMPISIDTCSLSDGKHTLEVHVQDASFHANTTVKTYDIYVDNTPLQASLIDAVHAVDQGKTLWLQFQANKKVSQACVTVLGKTFCCYPAHQESKNYECFIPVDCDEQPGENMLTVTIRDNARNEVTLLGKLDVREFPFTKQKGFSINPEKLENEKQVGMSNKILEEALEKWLEHSPRHKLWSGHFMIPTVVKRISTPFGEIRTTHERGRYLHKGVDLINTPKSVVWASQSGKVIIKDRYAISGNTVVLDHGLGVFTLYAHLDCFGDFEVGDALKKGNPVGSIGMTGYASGYHLHWELRVNNIPVDPFEWTTRIC